MTNVSFIKFSTSNNNNDMLIAQLVECYRRVFADRPWNEWLKCSKCQKYWGIKDKALLISYKFNHCNLPLVDFWPREQVLSDFCKEVTSDSSCWFAINKEKVIGFCWGYQSTISDLETKLNISFGDEFKKYFGISKTVAYQDEVGVISRYRGNKIAKTMIIHRLDDFMTQGLQVGIVRTRKTPEPSETFLWYTKKLGYKILANYPNDDGRVILGRQLFGLKELMCKK